MKKSEEKKKPDTYPAPETDIQHQQNEMIQIIERMVLAYERITYIFMAERNRREIR